MTFRLPACGLAGLVCGAALAQPPAVPVPAEPPPVNPAQHTQTVPAPAPNWSAEVSPGGRPADGSAAFAKAVADARTALAKARDYTAGMVRQERVNGALLPEQTCTLAARTQPLSVAVTVSGPKPYAGASTSFLAGKTGLNKVRHRPAGPEGTRPTKTVLKDDPAVLAAARHPVDGYGLAAVLDRVEGLVRVQKLQHRPTQILAGDYTFGGKPVARFEVFADSPSAAAPRRVVLCLDAATKLPVRYEAYGPPTPDAPGGEVLEVVSFVNTRLNVGLADAVFDR
jgi:hypothetical protein